MEEKKVIKVSFGVAICIFIILILVVALGITYYIGFVKNGVDHEQFDFNDNKFVTEKEENNNVIDNTNIIEESNKKEIKIPSSNNKITIGTTKDVVKSYLTIDKQLRVEDTGSGAYYDIIKAVNGFSYYIWIGYDGNGIVRNITVYCRESKDGISEEDEFDTVKEFFKDYENVYASQEKGVIIVNINDEYNNISIKYDFTNNKLTNTILYLNNKDSSNEENNKEDNVIIKEVVKEIEKQVDVNDVIKLGYNQIAVLINGKPYVIPVYDRENNFENYQLYEVKNITGKVKALRQFNTGLDPSETHYLIMEDGSVYWIDGVGNNSTAEKKVDASKNIIDIVEENEIVYAVSKNGEKIKIAEMHKF